LEALEASEAALGTQRLLGWALTSERHCSWPCLLPGRR
jgi:hypothetical protein